MKMNGCVTSESFKNENIREVVEVKWRHGYLGFAKKKLENFFSLSILLQKPRRNPIK